MKNLIYLLTTLSLIVSCTKEEPSKEATHTVAGRIVADCALTPLANTPMKLFVEVPTSAGNDIEIYDFTSDANGYFSYTFM